MATKKKMLQAAAGNAVGAALNVEDVFSTYLYEGNGSTQTITNGVDLDGEGGLVWTKRRGPTAESHGWVDTVRGGGKVLRSDVSGPEVSNTYLSFNSDGYLINTSNGIFNASSQYYASWTFRKAPKFFDVVAYTGDGTIGRTVSHNLGVAPGMMIVKRSDSTGNWCVYHRGLNYDGDNAPETDFIYLNSTSEAGDSIALWNDTAPTETEFTLYNNSQVNAAGDNYIAYLFAHNDGDGEFGPNGDADIIKCGSYTGNGTNLGPKIDLGFEPQFILVKNVTDAQDWILLDTARGLASRDGIIGEHTELLANTSNYENYYNHTQIFSDGFQATDTTGKVNTNGSDYIYIAIRRGQMAAPESASDVFSAVRYDGDNTDYRAITTGIFTDAVLMKKRDGGVSVENPFMGSRLAGYWYLQTHSTSAKVADTDGLMSSYQLALSTARVHPFGLMDGFGVGNDTNTGINTPGTQVSAYAWKRASKFFDVVAYRGDGVVGRNVPHNLGATPEMMWVKCTSAVADWAVYHKETGNTKFLKLNTGNVPFIDSHWNNTDPTETHFTTDNDIATNATGRGYIAYLFASLPGISKVGSYAGNGGTQTIDCGFSGGARFVIIKDIDRIEDWYVFDTASGIVSGNDPYFTLNTTAEEVTTADLVGPDSSGFTVNNSIFVNRSGENYIFYAVA